MTLLSPSDPADFAAAKFAYFAGSKPRVLAHRGLTFVGSRLNPTDSADVIASIDENCIQAFINAQDAGAQLIESDIQVTKDGVAVLFHDDDLRRVAGLRRKVSHLTLAQLQKVTLEHGARIPTLRETLMAMPLTRFNLDFKVRGAIAPAARIIQELGAYDRVLVTSFSESRRRAALRKLQRPMASSASSQTVLRLWFAAKTGNRAALARLASGIQALQIPTHFGKLNLSTPSFIQAMHSVGLEVHYWTINDPDQMLELLRLGADGLVTDRADLAAVIVDRFKRFG